jgi:hypothetical protein
LGLGQAAMSESLLCVICGEGAPVDGHRCPPCFYASPDFLAKARALKRTPTTHVTLSELDLLSHPETIVTSRLSDEELASLARQVRLRQRHADG